MRVMSAAWFCMGALAVLGTLCVARAEVKIEHWRDVEGFEITDALAQGELERKPDEVRMYSAFEAVAGQTPDVLRVSGVVLAPMTGAYRFMIAGDDTAVLFVSSDDRAENLQQVAVVPAFGGRCDWMRYGAQTSAPIQLVRGKRYLVSAYLKNGDGQGHLEVGWRLPDGSIEGPIPAERLGVPSRPLPVPAYGKVEVKVMLRTDQPPATTPGHHKFVAGAKVQMPGKEFDASYLLFLPGDWEKTTDSRPMFIFLHGNWHQGMDLEGILNEGPAQYLQDQQDLRQWFPMVALFPQLPAGWRWDMPGAAELVVAMVQEICRKYPRVDPNRIYLSGLSMGGKGTWLTAYASPQTFAAIAPISAVAVRPKAAAGKFAGLYTWIICGEKDHLFTQGSKDMYEAMRPLGDARVQLTVVPDGEHGCWSQYYPTKEFYLELMKHCR